MKWSGNAGYHDTLFSIKLHHGGKFIDYPGRAYTGGKIDHIDLLDIVKFSVHELDRAMVMLGYKEGSTMYYHYLRSGQDLDAGLCKLLELLLL